MKFITLIIATRPNFMKAVPVYNELSKLNKYKINIIHTGQHYDYNMSEIFLKQLDINKIINLNIGQKYKTQNSQIAHIMIELERYFDKNNTDLVLVFGDVTSTVAAAITSNKLSIPVAHVESGNRSFDRSMPEEINRIITDSICDYHFIAEPYALDNLKNEGLIKNDILNKQTVFYVGNTMIDTLLKLKPFAEKMDIYKKINLEKNNYILVTLHRPHNVDNNDNLKIIIAAFIELASKYKIVFPVHPRKKEKINNMIGKNKNILLIEPQGYLEFMNLHINCGLLITDSGGLQEESSILKKPCITLRPNTERPITCTHGTNYLLRKLNKDKIIKKASDMFGKNINSKNIPLWDGFAGKRIADIIDKII